MLISPLRGGLLRKDSPQRHKDTKTAQSGVFMRVSGQVIGLAIEVHRQLGPGLLESAYEECLCQELREAGLPFAQQVALPIIYKGRRLSFEYRMDIVVEPGLVLEIKSVARLLPLHEAQLLTYLRLSGHRVGLLMNFNCPVLKDGIRRRVL
ncbi:MAG TPA: GxxExxY protein [Acetobacteraceae bacterium]